jgi:hypothetical protein
MARKNIAIARAGNYTAPVDTSGMDPDMKTSLTQGKSKPMDQTESTYVAGAKNKDSATEAVRRARRANKAAPLPGE